MQGCISRVVLQSSGTVDLDKLAISQSLMPLYHKLGKFIETMDSLKSCAVNVAILHVPSYYPVKGFDMNTCPNWNSRDIMKLKDMLSISSHFLGPEGILLCICSGSFCGPFSSIAGAHKFREDHATCIMTKSIHGLVDGILVSIF